MSSRRKVRSSRSIYHPGISLSHEPTYNQKKGMILTRSTNLPSSPTATISSQSLYKQTMSIIKSNRIKTRMLSIDYEVPLNDVYTFDLNDDTLIPLIKEKLNADVDIYQAACVGIAVQNSSARDFPSVSYTVTVGDQQLDTITTVSGSNLPIAHSINFDMPYINMATTSGGQVSWPRLYKGSSNSARVEDYTFTVNSSNIKALVQHGVNQIPFYSRGNVYGPYDNTTVLTVDTTNLSLGPYVLRLMFMIAYVNK